MTDKKVKLETSGLTMPDGRKNNGGARAGAGAKPSGKPPKRPFPAKVSQEAREKVKEWSLETGHSQAKILEYLVKKTKEIPKNID